MGTLTVREREVARLLAKGRTTSEAAAALNISEKTVQVHRTAIYQKLHPISNVVNLTHYCLRVGLIQLKSMEDLGVSPYYPDVAETKENKGLDK
jgi:DNA-binding NarL/FixJ family response regulator